MNKKPWVWFACIAASITATALSTLINPESPPDERVRLLKQAMPYEQMVSEIGKPDSVRQDPEDPIKTYAIYARTDRPDLVVTLVKNHVYQWTK